jgi:DNA-binding LacI/PurR family transcriptional regulator
MPATLKDVARRAGVSAKTVSNVIHHHPAVAPATRARVKDAIASLGYKPNLGARHLRRARVGAIALAIPDLGNSYFADVATAVVAAATDRDYAVLIEHTGGERAKEALVVNGLGSHLIDGLILSALALELADLSAVERRVPVVLLGERFFGAPFDHVAVDNVTAARVATRHLVDLGRRRIAAIGVRDGPGSMTAELRLQGYIDALNAAGLPVDPRLQVPVAGFQRADGAEAMRRLLALDVPPDAVFCFNDLLALGAMRTLYQAGQRVPDDVAVVGFDGVEDGAYATPALTTIVPDKPQIGRGAVSLLLGRIMGTRIGPPENVIAPFELAVRESTGPPGAASAPAERAPPHGEQMRRRAR